MYLIRNLQKNWDIVIRENKKEEEKYREEYEKGIRRSKDLGVIDRYFKKLSEEMERIDKKISEEKKRMEEEKAGEMIDPGPALEVMSEMLRILK